MNGFWPWFAIGAAVGAVVVLPAAIAINNWLDWRYQQAVGKLSAPRRTTRRIP